MRATSVDEILRYCEEFFPGEPPEFFFDRNPENFPAILDMYRSVSIKFVLKHFYLINLGNVSYV